MMLKPIESDVRNRLPSTVPNMYPLPPPIAVPPKQQDKAGVPLWLAACIFVAFLALAVVGIVFVYNLLFGAKAVDLEPAATEDVISTAKAVLFGGEIL